MYSRPGPLSISPREAAIPLILIVNIIRIPSFKWQMDLCILGKCLTALKLSVTYQSFLPICQVGIPWMLNEWHTFPPKLESLQTRTCCEWVEQVTQYLSTSTIQINFFTSNLFINWTNHKYVSLMKFIYNSHTYLFIILEPSHNWNTTDFFSKTFNPKNMPP